MNFLQKSTKPLPISRVLPCEFRFELWKMKNKASRFSDAYSPQTDLSRGFFLRASHQHFPGNESFGHNMKQSPIRKRLNPPIQGISSVFPSTCHKVADRGILLSDSCGKLRSHFSVCRVSAPDLVNYDMKKVIYNILKFLCLCYNVEKRELFGENFMPFFDPRLPGFLKHGKK